MINVNYDGKRLKNTDLPSGQQRFGEFEYKVFHYEKDPFESKIQADLSSLSPSILVDFNAQYTSEDDRHPTHPVRCVFPMQYMWKSKQSSNYSLLMQPRNIIHCSMDATSGNPDIQPLIVHDKPDEKREDNDLARGAILIGTRMFFYSALENALYVSEKNNFRELFPKGGKGKVPTRIVPPEELQGLTDFNGNIITFTPTGIERWVLSGDDNLLIQRDPTFHYDHRIRYGGSFV